VRFLEKRKVIERRKNANIYIQWLFRLHIEQKNKKININDIKVKRIKSIAIALGYTDTISMEEYLNIQKMILKAEEPFYNGTELVFPRVQLVKMLEDKSINPSVYQKYANEILLRNNIVPRQFTIEEAERD